MAGDSTDDRRRPPRRRTPRLAPQERTSGAASQGTPGTRQYAAAQGRSGASTRPPARSARGRDDTRREASNRGRDRSGRGQGAYTGERGRGRPPRTHDDRPRVLNPRLPAQPSGEAFTCGHCGRYVGPLPSGGHHRNHCPYCLYSLHVDDLRSGDRANPCGGLMAPIGAFQRRNGEHVIVHRCERCGFERFNRIQADDDFDLVLSLPVLPPRSPTPPGERAPGPGGAQQGQG